MENAGINSKSQNAVGVLNIALGIALFLHVILLGIMAVGCLLMSFSLFFMAAIPAFMLIGFLTFATFIAAIVNIGEGLGLIIAANKSRKVSTVFAVVALVTDCIILPVDAVALACGIYLLLSEINFLSVSITIASALVLVLAVAALILSLIRFTQSRRVKA